MEWRDVANAAAKAAPVVGSLLGGPAGGAVGALVASALGVDSTPPAVAAAIATNPDAAIKLRELERDERLGLAQLANQQRLAEINADSAAVGDTNKTMQAEAASEHWPTYSWRPAIGFAVALAVAVMALTVAGVYIAAMASGLTKPLEYLPGMLAAMAGVIGVASPILGIASWFRGRMQADPSIPTVNRG